MLSRSSISLFVLLLATPALAQVPLPEPRPGTANIPSLSEPLAIAPMPVPPPAAASIPALVVTPTAPVRASAGSQPPSRATGPIPAPKASVAQVRVLLDHLKAGRLSEANAITATLRDPAARALAEWLTVRYASRQMGHARLSAFAQNYPDWPGLTLVRRRAEEALYLDDAPPAAVSAFFGRQQPFTGLGRLAVARAFLAKGDRANAAAHARAVWREEDMPESVQRKMLQEFGRFLTAEDYRYRAERLLYKERVNEALLLAPKAGPGYVQLAQARAAVIRGQKDAMGKLDAVPASLRKEAGYLWSLSQFRRRAGRIEDAAQAVLAVPASAAAQIDTKEWWIERRMVLRGMLDKGDPRTAYRIAAAHVSTEAADIADAEFTAGWIALRFLNDPRTAQRHFARIEQVGTTPITLSRARYWLGRAAEAAGDQGTARRHYQGAAAYATTYYGQLALAKLGRHDVPLRMAPRATAEERTAFQRRIGVRAVEMLYAAGGNAEALSLLSALSDDLHTPGEHALLAELVSKHGDARALTMIGKNAIARGHPLDDVAFPLAGIPKFQMAGPKVELALVYAITRQESLFHASAKSHAGALGLMQLMPATARKTAQKFGIPYNPSKLTDPAYNAQLGATHLGELTSDYSNSYILTFVAYNAGPKRAQEWIERYGDPRDPRVDAIDWVERIPFSETRNYVQRVMENVMVYRARLGANANQPIEAALRGHKR